MHSGCATRGGVCAESSSSRAKKKFAYKESQMKGKKHRQKISPRGAVLRAGQPAAKLTSFDTGPRRSYVGPVGGGEEVRRRVEVYLGAY